MSVPRFALLAAMLPVLLGACASQPGGRLEPIAGEGFELVGRIAIRYGLEGVSGRINWSHRPGSDELLITSVLGQGVARITRAAGEVKLVTADRREFTAADAEALTEQVLGWRLPLEGLPDWVQGRAHSARAPARLTRDAQGRLSELQQDDWRVEYQDYEGGQPSRIRIWRADMEIRLLVEQWAVSR